MRCATSQIGGLFVDTFFSLLLLFEDAGLWPIRVLVYLNPKIINNQM